MTRIDFYILEDEGLDAAMRFACRLSLKAYQSGHPVHIRAASTEQAAALDELMWDYPKQRFIPHRVNQRDALKAPIHICTEEPTVNEGLLINLGEDVPVFFWPFRQGS